ncbi:hypothetical protein BDZ45DRAFT_669586 [Acephala macrosclerotiorum]|nr:hypothetical protein BDZ45DRAFT_669586 [Acephala macrosclerotiorum]
MRSRLKATSLFPHVLKAELTLPQFFYLISTSHCDHHGKRTSYGSKAGHPHSCELKTKPSSCRYGRREDRDDSLPT